MRILFVDMIFCMKAVRKIIDGNQLETLFALPQSFRNTKAEILILPAQEKKTQAHASVPISADSAQRQFHPKTQSLIGAYRNNPIPDKCDLREAFYAKSTG
jgi:hypothetical protein